MNRFFRCLGLLALHMLCPVSCPVCGRLGEVLCEDCLASILLPPAPGCLRCGRPLPCPVHPQAPPAFAASPYGGDTVNVILALKYGGFRALGYRLGRGMASLWVPPEGLDLLLPVPLHKGSSRGYNQAFEIARGMGSVWGIRAIDAANWARVLPPRVGLSREERQSLRPDAFGAPRELRGLRVALVDDVRTTGATLACLASACEEAGAEVLGAYTAAKP